MYAIGIFAWFCSALKTENCKLNFKKCKYPFYENYEQQGIDKEIFNPFNSLLNSKGIDSLSIPQLLSFSTPYHPSEI